MTDTITPREAAERAGVCTVTMRRWLQAGLIEATKTPGGRWRLTPEALDRVLNRAVGHDRG